MPEQSLEINKHVVKDCLLSYAKETIGDGQYSSCTNVLYNKARVSSDCFYPKWVKKKTNMVELDVWEKK